MRRFFYSATVIAALLLFLCGCEDGKQSLQRTILNGSLISELADVTYMFPANRTIESETEYLPLRKWDIIFTGDRIGSRKQEYETSANLLIPGTYNHILVYMGKDADGFAYAVELNVDDIEMVNGEATAVGGIRLLCLGTDYGDRLHSSGRHVIDRDYYSSRWAKTFISEARSILSQADSNLTVQVQADLDADYAYELEFEFSTIRIVNGDLSIRLVDDGRTGGSGCSDYWTDLFERHAGICFSGVRMSGADIIEYFTNSADGKGAFLPSRYNPLGEDDIYIFQLIQFGFTVEEDAQHACGDQTPEAGLVLPDLILASSLLEETIE